MDHLLWTKYCKRHWGRAMRKVIGGLQIKILFSERKKNISEKFSNILCNSINKFECGYKLPGNPVNIITKVHDGNYLCFQGYKRDVLLFSQLY
jgi:hypothetical protein